MQTVDLNDADALKAAKPKIVNGELVLDPAAIEAREDAMVRRMLVGPPVTIAIIGGSHDLTDNIERHGGGTVEYLRVKTKAYAEH